MSSEEMRIELESFVNRGLQEGWGGWPAKSEISGVGWVLNPRATTFCILIYTCNGCWLGGVYTA